MDRSGGICICCELVRRESARAWERGTDMTAPTNQPSLWEATGAIRHLDALRARQLVEAFRRPLTFAGNGLTHAADDPVLAEGWNGVTLTRVASHDGTADVAGSWKTNLHLHGLLHHRRRAVRPTGRAWAAR